MTDFQPKPNKDDSCRRFFKNQKEATKLSSTGIEIGHVRITFSLFPKARLSDFALNFVISFRKRMSTNKD